MVSVSFAERGEGEEPLAAVAGASARVGVGAGVVPVSLLHHYWGGVGTDVTESTIRAALAVVSPYPQPGNWASLATGQWSMLSC